MDIRCNKIVADQPPVYRIFLDQQLVVERRFWPDTPDYYIQEQLTMINDGTAHHVQIKNVFNDRGEIFLHDVKFLNGKNKETITVDHNFIVGTRFTFALPKR